MKIDIERYKVPDAFTIKELTHLYHTRTPDEKAEWVQRFAEQNAISLEFAKIILDDKDIQPRIALARYAVTLDYHGPVFKIGDRPILDLAESLLKDDELVRCALCENPAFGVGEGSFLKAGQTERLAMMRNASLQRDLILKIYDFENIELGLIDDDRLALIRAFCANREKIKEIQRDFLEYDDPIEAYVYETFHKNLFEKTMRWLDRNPEVIRITIGAYAFREKHMVEAYEKLSDKKFGRARFAIFENPIVQKNNDDLGYDNLFKKGLDDRDDWIRYISAAMCRALSKEDTERLVQGKHEWTFRGLLFNRHLNLESMQLLEKNLDGFERIGYGEIRAFRERFSAKQSGDHLKEAELCGEDAIEETNLDDTQKMSIKMMTLEHSMKLLALNVKELSVEARVIQNRMLTGKKLFWYAVGFLILLSLMRPSSP